MNTDIYIYIYIYTKTHTKTYKYIYTHRIINDSKNLSSINIQLKRKKVYFGKSHFLKLLAYSCMYIYFISVKDPENILGD